MQLVLSNLVDLALGKPESMECDNFNFLHTVLHVMLRKMKLSKTKVELTDELASRAEIAMKTVPTEPSICFREVSLKVLQSSRNFKLFSLFSVRHKARRRKNT